MKKPGWKPKKGLVEPKPKLAVSPAADTSSSSEAETSDPTSTASPSPDQLPNSETTKAAVTPSPKREANKAMDTGEEIDLTEPKKFSRPAWKSGIHWMAFFFAMMFDIQVLRVGLIHHVIDPHPMTMVAFQKELIMYALCIFLNALVLPSIVFEAQWVELRNDCLIVKNLLFKSKVPWSSIQSIFDPMYLKFAVIRTPRFFQLINKRDIKGFDELLHTIKVKAGLPSK